MKALLIFLLTVFAITGFAQKPFEVNGAADSSLNGKYIYLYGVDWSKLNPKLNDSCLIKNGQFTFKGQLTTPGLLISLYLKNQLSALTQVYIQPGKIEVALKSTNWSLDENVFVRNAFIHDQYKQFRAQTNGKALELSNLHYRIDSLRNRHPDSSFAQLNASADSIDSQLTQLQKNYVHHHPEQYMSLVVLSYFLNSKLKADEMYSLYQNLSNTLKTSIEGKLLNEKINRIIALQVGKHAPEFSLNDTAQRIVKLSAYKGQYVLLDFWASWCQPCLQQVPALKKFYEINKDKKLQIIGISLDEDKSKWVSAIQQYNLDWQQLSDLKGWKSVICETYNVESIPRNILINPKGIIIGMDVDLEKFVL